MHYVLVTVAPGPLGMDEGVIPGLRKRNSVEADPLGGMAQRMSNLLSCLIRKLPKNCPATLGLIHHQVLQA